MYLTWLDNNSWLLEIASQRILVDPWLVDSLTFGNLDWLFKGSKSQEHSIPENIDLILLSQGLEDHTHLPTLKQLDHKIQIVASPNAAKVVQGLGYTSVTSLAHGEIFTLNNQVEIKAFPGSPIGPLLVENAYLLKDLESGLTLYYEPHGYHSSEIKQVAPIDIVITPVVNLALPLVGAIVKGHNSALDVAQSLQPQIMLPTAAGGNVMFAGLLAQFLTTVGSVKEFRLLLEKNNLATQIMELSPGDRLQLNLEKRALKI